MSAACIRPLALCVFHRDGRILVQEARDTSTGQCFSRPLGGGIDFGESSAAAIAREIREEIGAEISEQRLLGTLENIFTYRGIPGHEIVQVYDARFIDSRYYALASIPGVESDGQTFEAVWRALAAFPASMPLYPAGLIELLRDRLT